MTTALRSQPRSTTTGIATDEPRPADAFVAFGITGDLAKVMTFRSLYRLERRGLLELPDRRRRGRRLDGRRPARARADVDRGARGEPVDEEVFERFAARLSYVAGDFADPETFERVRAALGGARTPGVLPRDPAVPVRQRVKGLADAGLTKGARVVVEKPFGHDVTSARALNDEVHQYLDESQLYRIDHFLGKMGLAEILYLRFANTMFEPIWNRTARRVACRSRWPRASASRTAGTSTTRSARCATSSSTT